MKIPRSSGLLMHITSLPGKSGIGDLGREAFEFINLLKEGGQKYWQILPIGPVSPVFGCSPYATLSSFAGNTLFISLEMLLKEKWVRKDLMAELHLEQDRAFVDFDRLIPAKVMLLKKFSADFFRHAKGKAKEMFDRFCEESKHWLDDYALFMAAAKHFDNFNWLTWDEDLRLRKAVALEKWCAKLKSEVDFHKFIQFLFFQQWFLLKKYANDRGIRLIGDIPIYVPFDSTEVWANPHIFQLDKKTLRPLKVAGVPPDYFSKTGQRWGNPLYRWDENGKLNEETINWWASRFRHCSQLFDVTRIDHFKGFESYWAIPEKNKTAVKGRWEKGPGIDFFELLKKKVGQTWEDLPLVAEDLGVVTPEVEKLRDDLGLPGMKILQFAFDFNNKNPYLPHNYKTTHCVVYTGTHDNNTTNGWFYDNEMPERTRQYIKHYLRIDHRHEFHWELINLALSSIADLTIFPTQDILGDGWKSRMNTPGKLQHNWAWKLTPGRLTPEIMHRLKTMCILYNRA